jgi:hypothetical protein
MRDMMNKIYLDWLEYMKSPNKDILEFEKRMLEKHGKILL